MNGSKLGILKSNENILKAVDFLLTHNLTKLSTFWIPWDDSKYVLIKFLFIILKKWVTVKGFF